MASRYSVLRQYGSYVTPYNFDVIGQAMQYKQSRVDANQMAINEQVDQLLGIGSQIQKTEAKEYLYEKVNGLVNDVNQMYAGQDLSNAGVTRNIQSMLSQSLDTTVMNAYAGTLEFNKLRDKLEDMKLNNPKMYSATNEWYALQPYYQWLNDGQAGSRLNPLHYTPYTDYQSNLNEKMKLFRQNNKGKTIQIQDGQGGIREVTIDQMTEQEVRSIASQNLTQQERAQINIDGAYMAASNPELFTNTTLDDFISRYTNSYDNQIAILNAELEGVGGNETRRGELQNAIRIAQTERSNFVDRARSMIGESFDPNAAGAFIVEQRLLDGLAQGWKYDNSSEKYLTDKAYWDRANYNLKVQNSSYENAYKQALIEKYNADTALSLSKANPSNTNTFNSLPGTRSNAPATFNNINYSELVKNDMLTYGSEFNSSIDQLFSSLPVSQQSDLRAKLTDMQQSDPRYASFSEGDLLMEYFRQNGGASNSYLDNPGATTAYQNALAAERSLEGVTSVINQVEQRNDNIIRSDSTRELIQRQALRNPDLPVVLPDGRIVSAGYAIQQLVDVDGYDTLDLAVATSTADQLLAKIASANIIGGAGTFDTESTNPTARGIAERSIQPDLIYSAENVALLKSIGNIVGESITPDEVFEVGADGTARVRPYVNGEKYTTKLIRSLFNDYDRRREGSSEVDSVKDFKKDSRWRDDSAVSRLYAGLNDQTDIQDILSSYEQYTSTPLAYTFSKDAPQTDAERAVFRDLFSLYTAKSADVKKIKQDDLKNPSTVTVLTRLDDQGNPTYFLDLNGRGDPKKMVEVTPDELQGIGFPTQQESRKYRADRLQPQENSISFGSNYNSRYSEFLISQGYGGIATKDEFKNSIDNVAQDLYTTVDENRMPRETGYRNLVHSIIDNGDKFAIELARGSEFTQNGMKVNIYDKDEPHRTRRPLYSFSIPNVDYADDYLKILDVAPQFFLFEALRSVVNEQRIAMSRNPNAGLAGGWTGLVSVIPQRQQ